MTAVSHDAAVGLNTDGSFDVELFGPVKVGCGYCMRCGYGGWRSADCLNATERVGHHYRRHVDDVDLVTALVRWWLDDPPPNGC